MNHTKAHILITSTFSISYTIAALLFSIVVLGVSYGYFIQATVKNAVRIDTAETHLANLNSSIGDSEFLYMTLSSKITVELARAKGFTDVLGSKFITRPAVGSGGISLRNEI